MLDGTRHPHFNTMPHKVDEKLTDERFKVILTVFDVSVT